VAVGLERIPQRSNARLLVSFQRLGLPSVSACRLLWEGVEMDALPLPCSKRTCGKSECRNAWFAAGLGGGQDNLEEKE
jgi:hypothetical protein